MPDRILLVEDDPDWQEIIVEDLTGRGYDVTTVVSLRGALTMLEANPPYEVVITDIALSSSTANRDGVELLEIVHRRWPMTTAIAVSGRASKGNVERFKERYHALDYLDRSVLVHEPDNFLALVDRAAGLSRRAGTRGGGVSDESASVGGGGPQGVA